jgi:hypothetical protein
MITCSLKSSYFAFILSLMNSAILILPIKDKKCDNWFKIQEFIKCQNWWENGDRDKLFYSEPVPSSIWPRFLYTHNATLNGLCGVVQTFIDLKLKILIFHILAHGQ